jgi:lipopolysaccharide transport system permease protein
VTDLPRHYVVARGSLASELAAAGQDFVHSFQMARLWIALAFNDILARYRGSLLGPFWITLSTAAFVVGIALVYGSLMHVSNEKYVPWIATGVVMWNYFASSILEAGDSYLAGSAIIRASSIPLPLFVLRVIFRNMLNFGHQLVVVLVVALWYHYLLKINLPMFVFGFALVLLNLSWISFFTAIVAARFRDIQQVNATLLQLIFFISPVIWIPGEMAGARGILLLANPFAHMLDVTRNPLLGAPVHMISVQYLLVMAAGGWLVTYFLYATVRRRIVHYL